MIPPKFITFEQADTGLPGSVCLDPTCSVESVYAVRRRVSVLSGHVLPDGTEVFVGDDGLREVDQQRTVIRMRTGMKYEVLEAVSSVTGRIEAVSERD